MAQQPAAHLIHHPVGDFTAYGEKNYAGQDDRDTPCHLPVDHKEADPAAGSEEFGSYDKHPRQAQPAAKTNDVLWQSGGKNQPVNHLKAAQPV